MHKTFSPSQLLVSRSESDTGHRSNVLHSTAVHSESSFTIQCIFAAGHPHFSRDPILSFTIEQAERMRGLTVYEVYKAPPTMWPESRDHRENRTARATPLKPSLSHVDRGTNPSQLYPTT
jgi:hypothetical protein